jgi:hypothetical protein
MAKHTVYLFKGIPDLYADMKGNFFYKGRPAPKVYNNGSLAMKCHRTKRGLKKLRTLAYKATVEREEEILPF